MLRIDLVDTAGIAEGDASTGQRQVGPTAGLSRSAELAPDIEEAARTAAGQQRQTADVLLVCLDWSRPPGGPLSPLLPVLPCGWSR